MRSVTDYQSIRTPEEEDFEELVDGCFSELCDFYADEIAEHGMNWQQKASLMNRARQVAKKRKVEIVQIGNVVYYIVNNVVVGYATVRGIGDFTQTTVSVKE